MTTPTDPTTARIGVITFPGTLDDATRRDRSGRWPVLARHVIRTKH